MRVFGCYVFVRVFVHGVVTFLSVLLISPAARAQSVSATQTQSSSPAGKGEFDGPAELPREHVPSSLSATPAPGKTVTVHDGGDLSHALAEAACGDTIQLRAGATFTGNFLLPDKHCDASHWIILRTSAPDSKLPPEGARLTPCYAGVSSLPGRPAFKCASTENVMAKIESDSKGGAGPITFSDGASYYRFIGLEVTRSSAPTAVYNLVGPKGPAHHLVFDRMWMHGTAQDETVRGVMLSHTRYVAVVDSTFTDFHCVAKTGACVDSQAVSGGLGDDPMGPFKIANNFLEAAGEVIILGGGAATTAPSDVEIRHNHFFRPTSWKAGAADFVGGHDGHPFIVKNLFELKNAQRVLLEGNILENVWGGFSQAGFAILLTPKNQNNKCPACRVNDVTIRYNRVAHMASGMQIGNGLSDAGGASADGGRYSIHDIVFDDIAGQAAAGNGAFAQVSASGPPLHDVWLDHITAFPPRVLFNLGVSLSIPKISNFVFTNSIVSIGTLGITSTGKADENCAGHPQQQGMTGLLASCFTNATVTHNAIVGGGKDWPKGNLTLKNVQAVGFASAEKDRVLDFHLDQHSSCKGAASDGKDLGADIEAINKATSGAD
jgi:hypothetical protein